MQKKDSLEYFCWISSNRRKTNEPIRSISPEYWLSRKGQIWKANITIRGQKEQRFLCSVCRHTFTTIKGTLFYRLHEDAQTVLLVIAWLAYGYPL